MLVSGLGYEWWRSRKPPSNPARQQLVSTLPGLFGGASFSPDAGRIAFVQPVNGIPQIWVKNLNGGAPTQITFGETAADRPRWSPRNDQIVFTLGSLGRQEAPARLRNESIWSVSALGGIPRKIIDSGSNPNWSGDGSQLVFERSQEIWTARADGSQQRRVEGIPLIKLPFRFPDALLFTEWFLDRFLSTQRRSFRRFLDHPLDGRPGATSHLRFGGRKVVRPGLPMDGSLCSLLNVPAA